MDKRTTGIIATLVTVLICGCPGLFGLCLGATFAIVSFVPNAEIDIFGSHEPSAALTFGVVVLIISLVFVALPAILAFVTLRSKKPARTPGFNEPIPPAS
jgi:Na+/melibiose symporter-like transporter